jgi:hypothetical protein
MIMVVPVWNPGDDGPVLYWAMSDGEYRKRQQKEVKENEIKLAKSCPLGPQGKFQS